MVSGEIRELGDNTLTLATAGDQTRQVKVDANSLITLNGRQVLLKDLQKGDRVTIRMQAKQADTAGRVRAARPMVAEGAEAEGGERPVGPPVPAVALGAVLIRTPEGEVGVWRVAPQSPAAQAGLQPGDQIVEIDGREVAAPVDLLRHLAEKRAGDTVQITFMRDEQEHTGTATLMRRDELLGRLRQEWQERRAARREGTLPERETQTEPWLGLILGPPQEGGVSISRVLPNSPAAQAGIEAGDLLRSFDSQKVDSPETAMEALQHKKPGDKVPLQITRNGKEQTVEVTVASRERPREEMRRLRAERAGRMGEGERIEGMLRDLKKDLQDLRQEVQDLARKSSESQRR